MTGPTQHKNHPDHVTATSSRRPLRSALVALAVVLSSLAGVLGGSARARADGVDQGLGADFRPADNAYVNQPDLTPDQVSKGFGQAWQFPAVGSPGTAQVYAKPVVAAGTLVTATEDNVVYGVDPHTGVEKWHTVLTSDGRPLAADSSNRSWFFDTSKPVVDGHTCGDISPHVGITSTPAVGPDGTIYTVAKVGETPQADGDQVARFELHALDPATGGEKAGYPVVLGGNADNAPAGNGAGFAGAVENQRAALLIQNGVVYAAFAAHCDLGLYRGWVMGVDTGSAKVVARWTSETGANHIGGANDDDDVAGQLISPEGGIWEGGAPLVPDAAGTGFYLTTGNGDFPAGPVSAAMGTGALGNAVVHVTQGANGVGLTTSDFYIPNWAASLNKVDVDLGSGGPTLLPDDFGSQKYPHLLVVGGKSGDIWLADATHLNGFKEGSLDPNAGGALSRINVSPGVVFGKIAVYDGPGSNKYLYVRVGETLRAFHLGYDQQGLPRLTQVGRDTGGGVALGGSPVVTQFGAAPGSGLVWTEWEPNNDGTGSVLQAYSTTPNADGTLKLVWSGAIGQAAKFQSPTVYGGWVYTAGRDGETHAFHNPSQVPLTSTGGDIGKVVQGLSASGTVTLVARTGITVSGVSLLGSESHSFSLGTPAAPLPVMMTSGQSIAIPYTFAAPATTRQQAGQIVGSGLGYSDTLIVATSAGTVQVPLTGTAQHAQGDLGVNALLALGDYAVGDADAQPLTQSLTLVNDGATTLYLDHVDPPAAPVVLSGLPADGTPILPGDQLTVGVTFASPTLGAYDDRFTFRWHGSDGSGGSGPLQTTETEVTADGVTPADVLYSPAAPPGQTADTAAYVDFGIVPLGTSVTRPFTLANTGGAAALFSISKIPTTPGLTFPDPISEGTSLGGGQQITVPVTWTPSATGSLSDAWTVDVGGGAGKQRIAFVGTAVAAVPGTPGGAPGSPILPPAPLPVLPVPVPIGGGAQPAPVSTSVSAAVLPGVADRAAWHWSGRVSRVDAATVSLSGSAAVSYSHVASDVRGQWTLALSRDGERLDFALGSLRVSTQRHGATALTTVSWGRRQLASTVTRLSAGASFRFGITVASGRVSVSIQQHALPTLRLRPSGRPTFSSSGPGSATVRQRGSATARVTEI